MKLFNLFGINVFLVLSSCIFNIVAFGADSPGGNFSFHIVEPGENVYRLSLEYGISQNQLLEMNGMKDTSLKVGQKLKVPLIKNDPNKKNISVQQKEIDINKNTTKNNNIDSDAKNENVKKVVDTTIVKTTTPNSQIMNTTFVWPVRGVVLTKFGYQTNSGKLEGVNIGCENDSIVRATASGEVVYNDKVDGFGNVILIRHYNGFLTAYGYTDPLVVNKDRIKKGQVIARVARSSKSKRSMLYFSIRKNGKSYDPEKLIPVKISN